MNSATATFSPRSGLSAFATIYQNELLENILPFWMKYSPDKQNGGYFTCLNRDGSVYDTDKFMWLQGRQVWCFSYMYNNIQQRPDWLDTALHGAGFMKKHGRDENGNWYFSLTAEGKPLVQPYNIFSDCFATMAFASLDKAMPSDNHKQIAIDTFNNILKKQHNWKGRFDKSFPGTRPMKNFSLPMILCNLSLELEHVIGSAKANELAKEVIEEVTEFIQQLFLQNEF